MWFLHGVGGSHVDVRRSFPRTIEKMSLWLVRDLLNRVNGKTAVIISSPVLQRDIKGGFGQASKKSTFI